MGTKTFDLSTFNVKKYNSILKRGLSSGLGDRGKQVCIEAAICETLNLPHGDDPRCVSNAIRAFKISLNDSKWSSPKARAKGLKALGIAQLGSLGVVDDAEFTTILSKKIIGTLIPKLFLEVFPADKNCIEAAKICRKEKSSDAAYAAYAAAAAYAAYAAANAAASAAYAAYAAYAAAYAIYATDATYATYAADAANAANAADAANAIYAANAANADANKYLILAAKLALDILKELKSPGVQLLGKRG